MTRASPEVVADRLLLLPVDPDDELSGLRLGARSETDQEQLRRGFASGLEPASATIRRPRPAAPAGAGAVRAGAGSRARPRPSACSGPGAGPGAAAGPGWSAAPAGWRPRRRPGARRRARSCRGPSLPCSRSAGGAGRVLLAGVGLLAGALVLQRHQPYGGSRVSGTSNARRFSVGATGRGSSSGRRRRARCRTASTWRRDAQSPCTPRGRTGAGR